MAAADTPGPGDIPPAPVLVVPEIRDYLRINAELVRLLDAGAPVVRLVGVDGQRLLARGLKGSWRGTVLVEGDAGPELAADLDAPGLIVACTGSARDGAGRGLRAGRLAIAGDADAAVGYDQTGGTIAVGGSVGSRAGLRQRGGLLVIAGSVDRLAGDRQSGGLLIAPSGPVGPFAGHGRTGGRLVGPGRLDEKSLAILRAEAQLFGPHWPAALSRGEGVE